MTASGVILAAGKGTRMVSSTPKALHRLCGLPLTEHCVRAMRGAGVQQPILVVGHGAEEVKSTLGDSLLYATQEQQLGTGHALLQALPLLTDVRTGHVLAMPGDAPLVTSEILLAIRDTHLAEGAQVTLAVGIFDDPTGYGRIIRDDAGRPVDIVEEKDCSPEQKRLKEVCVSLYCFDLEALRQLLPQLDSNNAQREFYLTDIVKLADHAGLDVSTWCAPDPTVLMGVNDRWQLSVAARELGLAKLKKLAMSGVTIIDPETTYVDMDVTVGVDSTIEPASHLLGKTRIGLGCTVGPGSRLVDAQIADGARVLSSNLMECSVGAGTRVGPFANIRPGARIGEQCSIGDYVEIKASTIGDRVSIAHLSYIGDATVGDGTNIGAGTITCNYDGKNKHRTTIGSGVFIGSNNTLVAPVSIGDGAFTAAGSTITEDVPPDSLGLGRARQVNKEGWAQRWRSQS